MSESEYIRRELEQHPDESEYLSDLRILRRFVQIGSFGRERKREVLERYTHSTYIEEQRRTYPNNPDKDNYLKSLERLRHVMILFRLGYGSREMAMKRVNSSRRYPEAYKVFEDELDDL